MTHPTNFRHPYHQTLTMKMTVCDKGGGLRLTCEQALEVMRKIDNLTCGIPKIIYLVGWQYDGHDTGYPAWDVVNHRIKRDEDDSALDSLKWLMEAAFHHNTTVSLHINMIDAQEDSPLWDLYIDKDVLARNLDGSLKKYKWGYPMSYTREWIEGLTTARIDRLTLMLPLAKAGTIHIDAFHQYVPGFADEPISPYHGISTEQELAAQKQIIQYWNDKGVDVTSEFDTRYRIDPLIGLQPFAWHFGRLDPMEVPASVYVGGEGGDPRFGVSMLGQGIFKRHPDNLKGFLSEFCTTTLPWYYLNRLDRVKDEDGIVYFSGEVTSSNENENLVIKHGERLLRDSNDLFIPALWNAQKYKEIIAFSETGCTNRTWQMPEDWEGIQQVDLYAIGLEGLTQTEKNRTVTNGEITLSLRNGQAISIQPAK